MSRIIIVTTVGYWLITAGCFVIGIFHPIALLPATLVAVIGVVCYLTAPVEFDLTGDRLTVFTRIGSREFSPIVKCEPVTKKIYCGIRVFGNGGVFAGTGWFWAAGRGIYRAYVTSARTSEMLWLETPREKVVITPENPSAFCGAAGASDSSRCDLL